MSSAEAAARSLAWEEAHPRSPPISPRGVGSFLEPPKQAMSTRDAISNAYAECDRDQRRMQRTRMLTQGQRPQSASADQRRERQRARELHRAITQPDDRQVEELRRVKEARLLQLGRTLLAQAEAKLATTHERTQAQRRTTLQAREHARQQALVDELGARAEQQGDERWQRAVDSSLVHLLETREAEAASRREQRRRRHASIAEADAWPDDPQPPSSPARGGWRNGGGGTPRMD